KIIQTTMPIIDKDINKTNLPGVYATLNCQGVEKIEIYVPVANANVKIVLNEPSVFQGLLAETISASTRNKPIIRHCIISRTSVFTAFSCVTCLIFEKI